LIFFYKLVEQEKCARYWPGPNSNGAADFGPFTVHRDEKQIRNLTMRTLTIKGLS
jgi:hypothetical protein